MSKHAFAKIDIFALLIESALRLKEDNGGQDRPNLPQRDQSLMELVLSALTLLDLVLQQHEAIPHDSATSNRESG